MVALHLFSIKMQSPGILVVLNILYLHENMVLTYFSNPLLWDKDPSLGRRNNIILQGNRTFLSTTLRSSIPLAGRADTVPDREAIAMEQRGLTSHLAQILVSPTPTTPPVKVIVASTSWGKVQLLFTLNPFLDTCSPNREISHKNAFSRPQ